jgi:hypothetical protein
VLKHIAIAKGISRESRALVDDTVGADCRLLQNRPRHMEWCSEKRTRSSEGRPAVSPISSGPVTTRRCWPRISTVVFQPPPLSTSALHSVAGRAAPTSVRSRGVLLADHPLSAFRRNGEGVLERCLRMLVTLEWHITKADALKEVGHIHRTDQFGDLMPVPTVAAQAANAR